jgi:hypothetical protein
VSGTKTAEAIRVRYPFVRVPMETFDYDGPNVAMTWIPGVRYEPIYPDTAEAVADGEGWMTLTVVSSHKPGRFPERVFFTRTFTPPDGPTFGKTKLHIATRAKFSRICRGYGYPYRNIAEKDPAK